MPLDLPAEEAIKLSIRDGAKEDYDLINLYYRWYSGWFYRHRLQMIADLIGDQRVGHALEVGVGSGIFIKELLRRADHLTGFDLRTSIDGIKEMMAREKIDHSRVTLSQGDVFNMPYKANIFDLLVCVSVLEHFADPRPAVEAMARVVKPGGVMAFGFPAETPFTASLFRALGYEPKDLHPASHTLILDSIRAILPIDEAHFFPLRAFPMYVACRVVKPEG